MNLPDIIHQAQKYEASRDHAAAIRLYLKQLHRHPRHIDLYINLSALLIETGRYRQGLRICRNGLRRFRHPSLLFNAGVIHYHIMNYNESVNFFLECLTIQPEMPGICLYTGQAMLKAGEISQAAFFLRKVSGPSSDVLRARKLLLDLYFTHRKNDRKAFQLAEQILAEEPKYHKAHRVMAMIELHRGNIREAETRLAKALLHNPRWNQIKARLRGNDTKTFASARKPDRPWALPPDQGTGSEALEYIHAYYRIPEHLRRTSGQPSCQHSRDV